MGRVVTFGEILLRLSTPRHERISQARQFDIIYGGTECNVAVSLAQFGHDATYVSAVPANDLGQAAINYVRQFGVDTGSILRQGRRLGAYFLEIGAGGRASKVVYDRADSSASEIKPGMIDWVRIFQGKDWFHFSGITCAISASAASVVEEAAVAAKKAGLTVSCDFNYRATLWSAEKGRQVMGPIVRNVDVAIGSGRDPVLQGLIGMDGNIPAPKRSAEAYRPFIEAAVQKLGFKKVALTVRDIYSSSRNTYAGVYYDGQGVAMSRTHDIDIVDRVGGGDGFTAGIVHGILAGFDRQHTVDFAAAAAALAHTIHGDFNLVSVDEVEAAAGSAGADVRR
ncbi:MAG: sugar kinase [SAR202 cluster bacterium]|nr:sugar kinase [SAR202 cluster bacterium]